MKRKHWTLLVIAAGDRPLTPVQLQKSLFLLGKNLPKTTGAGFYKFEPYDYGPFDVQVYLDAEILVAEGLVEISQSGRGWNEYSATPGGRITAAVFEKKLNPKHASYIKAVVAWTQRLSFQALVRAIYAKYPSYRANSVFQP